GDGFQAGRDASAVDVHLPPFFSLPHQGGGRRVGTLPHQGGGRRAGALPHRGGGGPRFADAARVDVDHGGAAAELAGDLGDQLRRLDGGGVDADLLGPGLDQPGGVVERADAAADGEGHEDLL